MSASSVAVSAQISQEQLRVSRLIWIITFLVTVVDVVWSFASGIALNSRMLMIVFASTAMLGGLAWFYTHKRQDLQIRLMLEILMQTIIFSNMGAVLSYFAATPNLPLADETLIKADAAFGFDWHTYINFIHTMPVVTQIFTVGYLSMAPQFVLMLVLLFLTKNLPRLQQVILAAALSVVVAIVISAFIPSISAYLHHKIDGWAFSEDDIFLIREGVIKEMPLQIQGIIQFPSCHAVMAVIFMYATFCFGLLRLFFIPLNIILLLATPVDGGHYFVDVLAGGVIAIATLIIARKLLPIASPEKLYS